MARERATTFFPPEIRSRNPLDCEFDDEERAVYDDYLAEALERIFKDSQSPFNTETASQSQDEKQKRRLRRRRYESDVPKSAPTISAGNKDEARAALNRLQALEFEERRRRTLDDLPDFKEDEESQIDTEATTSKTKEEAIRGRTIEPIILTDVSLEETARDFLMPLDDPSLPKPELIAKIPRVILDDQCHEARNNRPRLPGVLKAVAVVDCRDFSLVIGERDRQRKPGYAIVLLGKTSDPDFPKKIVLVNNEASNMTYVISGYEGTVANWEDFVFLDKNDLRRLQPDYVTVIRDNISPTDYHQRLLSALQRRQVTPPQTIEAVLEQRRQIRREDGDMTQSQLVARYKSFFKRFKRELIAVLAETAKAEGVDPANLIKYAEDEHGTVQAYIPKRIVEMLDERFSDRKLPPVPDGYAIDADIIRRLKDLGLSIAPGQVRETIKGLREQWKPEIDAQKDSLMRCQTGSVSKTQAGWSYAYNPWLADRIVAHFMNERIAPENYRNAADTAFELASAWQGEGLTLQISMPCLEANIQDEAAKLAPENEEDIKYTKLPYAKNKTAHYSPVLRQKIGENLKFFATEHFESVNALAVRNEADRNSVYDLAVRLSDDPKHLQYRRLPNQRPSDVVHEILVKKIEKELNPDLIGMISEIEVIQRSGMQESSCRRKLSDLQELGLASPTYIMRRGGRPKYWPANVLNLLK